MLNDKIKEAVKEYGVAYLLNKLGISHITLYKIENLKIPISKKILDRVYRFFKIEFDEYYYKNIKIYNKESGKTLGTIIRRIRIYFGISMEELSYKSNISKKQINLIEKGKVVPNTSTVWYLLNSLPLPPEDKQLIVDILSKEKVIDSILKKYQIK